MTIRRFVSSHAAYAQAFEAAAVAANTRRKSAWRGRVRIRYRKLTGLFEVWVKVE